MPETNTNPTPQINPETSQNHPHKGLVKVLIILAVAVVCFITAYVVYGKVIKLNNEANPYNNQTQNTQDPTADWKTYRNEELGFEFKYPDSWAFKKDDDSPTAWFYIDGNLPKENEYREPPSDIMVFIDQNPSLLHPTKFYREFRGGYLYNDSDTVENSEVNGLYVLKFNDSAGIVPGNVTAVQGPGYFIRIDDYNYNFEEIDKIVESISFFYSGSDSASNGNNSAGTFQVEVNDLVYQSGEVITVYSDRFSEKNNTIFVSSLNNTTIVTTTVYSFLDPANKQRNVTISAPSLIPGEYLLHIENNETGNISNKIKFNILPRSQDQEPYIKKDLPSIVSPGQEMRVSFGNFVSPNNLKFYLGGEEMDCTFSYYSCFITIPDRVGEKLKLEMHVNNIVVEYQELIEIIAQEEVESDATVY